MEGSIEGERLIAAIHLPFPSVFAASTVGEVLAVDTVPGTEKSVQVVGDAKNVVEVKISASSLRNLRSAVGSVLEQAKLVTRTLRAFSNEV